jgi:DNA invertase Pin-like site-specific DNA recombinase
MTDSPFPLGTLAALYLRDSGGDEQELSTEQQERVLKDWAAVNGIGIGKIFRDSITGTSTKGRDDFLKMMRYFQHQPPEQGVLIWRSNRFGRNIDDSQYFKADLRRRGYFVHSITDNIPDGPMGRFIEFALDWKDEIFSAQLSEDVRRGLLDLVRTHGAVPGVPPRGFKREPINIGTRRNGDPHIVHKWVPDADYIPRVQKAFEMRARGATLKAIQTETKLYRSVNCWVTFFSNPIYKGILEYSDQTFENYCIPIVTPELWAAANQVGQNRRHIKKDIGQTRRLGSSFLLSGIARCQKCGHLLTGKVIKQWRYYACSKRMVQKDCDARQIPADQLDAEVMRSALNEILSIDNLMLIQARLITQYKNASEEATTRRTELTRRLSTVTRSINNLTTDIAEHGSSDAISKSLRSYETEAASLRLKITELEKQLTPPPTLSTASMTDIANEIRSILEDGTLEEKRYYLKAFLHHVSAVRDEDAIRGGIYYHPPFVS